MDNLIVRIGGGLGNQLFNYATGLNLARKTGRRLMLDLSEFAVMKGRAYGLDFFAGPAACPRIGKVLFAALAADRALQRVSKPLAAQTLSAIGLKWFKNADMLDTVAVSRMLENLAVFPHGGKTPYLTGCYSLVTFLPPREVLLDEFRINTENPQEGYCKDYADCNSVSIHVRRGDYLTLQGTGINLPIGYYKNAIEEMKRRVGVERWVVFSDDIEWCRTTFLDMAMENVEFVTGDTRLPAADLALMASCRHHIVANSTFSWWGAYLSREAGVTLYPEPWFTGYSMIPGVHVPREWIPVLS